MRNVILLAGLWSLAIGPAVAVAEPVVLPPLNAERAMGYLEQICRLGTRISGSEGMTRQQDLLREHFTKLNGKVFEQPFDVPHPLTGRPVRMTNLIVTWNESATRRVMFCTHYDTRPFPDRDRRDPQGIFLGANDGGSGVALFMELAHHMDKIKPVDWGIDFVFFDGEELVYRDQDKYFHGSEYFAKAYKAQPPQFRYDHGVLLDMVGGKKMKIYMEKNSVKYAPTQTRALFATAKELGLREFIGTTKHEVNDDHIPLNTIAGIPTCDLIDFDYPHWHTTRDIPENCSGESLVKVGQVLLTWVQQLPAPR